MSFLEPERILANNPEIEKQLFQSLEDLRRSALALGAVCRTHSRGSLQVFRALPEKQQEKILSYLRAQNSILAAVAVPTFNEIHPEKGLVEQALDFYGLEVRDDFWRTVDRNDLIEIYNADQVQIFRSLNFFKISSYSLLDLLVHEWYVLWERPQQVLNELVATARNLLHGAAPGLQKLHVPVHVLKEAYCPDDEGGYQLISVRNELGHLCPLYRKGLPVIGGFLLNSSNQIVARGFEADQIRFL